MDIISFKRNQEQHRLHLARIKKVTSVVDTKKPESLGLKHLAYRPKKQQLIDDQKRVISMENAKMMEMMTTRMAENRPQAKYVKPASLNDVERKMEVDRLNFENGLLLNRIKTVPPVISLEQMDKDFKRHLHAESVLRRKMPTPNALPKGWTHKVGNENEQMFDKGTYTDQKGGYGSNDKYEDSISSSPIKSMTDFRKHVISSKKNHAEGGPASPMRSPKSTDGSERFEMKYTPS